VTLNSATGVVQFVVQTVTLGSVRIPRLRDNAVSGMD